MPLDLDTRTRPDPFSHLPTFPPGSIDERMQRIARARHAAPGYDPHSDAHYQALVREADYQFGLLTGCYGVSVEFTTDDPYTDSGALCADIDAGRMRVWVPEPGNVYHPFLTTEEYGRLRAVHDYFGHYRGRKKDRTCHAFAWRGELNAFRAHLETISALAAPALAAEIIATNAEYAYGVHSDTPIGRRPFPMPKSWALCPSLWLPLVDDPGQLARLGSDPDLWRARAESYRAAERPHWSDRARPAPTPTPDAFAGCVIGGA